MTLTTWLGELAVVRIIGLVAVEARGAGLGEFLLRLVAGLTGQCTMRPFEREVGLRVVELRAVELHDVEVPALVLRMAGTAFAGACVGHAPVIALALAQVRGDVLVAVQTESGLRAAIRAPIVAVTARLLLLDVRLRNRPRHEQLLD